MFCFDNIFLILAILILKKIINFQTNKLNLQELM
jgi:hypothetical protein